MVSSFKIPKKKQSAGSDSAPLHASPLSRLQSSALEFKSYGDRSSRDGADRMHAGSTHRGAAAANSSGPSVDHHSQSQQGQRAASSSACFSNGWRPKRASDRLLQPDVTSGHPSPPQTKKKDLSGSLHKSISVRSLDSLAQLRGDEHAGSLSSSAPGVRTWRTVDTAEEKIKEDTGSSLKLQKKRNFSPPSGSDQASEDDFVFPSRTRNKPSVMSRRTLPKPKRVATEPIVLSSEEEDEDEGDGGQRTSGCQVEQPQQTPSSEGKTEKRSLLPPPPPSFLQLDFASLHAGLTHAEGNGKMTITGCGITLPLRGADEGEVCVVASQLRGYGVWDGGVARGGALLAGWEGPAPSLIFLWVTDAQANLLHRELTAIQTAGAAAGPACSVLLLVLKEQLKELQAALLASILDMEEYRSGTSSGGPTSPLEWTDGLLLLHSCPPPLDQHLLGLLGLQGQSKVTKNQKNTKSDKNSSRLQQLPTRLIRYPAAPSQGRITVTKEDLARLGSGEFLNDVIIDFYLKYLLLEGVGGAVAQRSYVFSSFFYTQLSRRRAAGEADAPSVPDRHVRHRRVKRWTRHVDIFTKDFLFVPVNQDAHWYLLVVCFPGLEEVQHEPFHSPTDGSQRTAGQSSSFSLRSQQTPECTQQSWQGNTVLKRPCILVMDSLKLSNHENVCRLVREYLQVEWEVRRGTPRLFTSEHMRSSNCRVPQQDNSSDCGLYLLQYAESFLQNPVVNFDLPLRLDHWFPRQRVRQKREEIQTVIVRMHQSQSKEPKIQSTPSR